MEDAGHHVEAEEKINFHSHAHVGTVLSSLEEQRKKDFLCDITLMVEDVQFRAHKALLAASSEYFSMMFADEGNIGQSVYVIEGIVSEVFESLLQFMYTGNVRISEKSLKQIVSTAHVLKIDNLVKAYIDYQQELLKPPVEVSDNKTVDEADEHVSKRKRGRPKKHSDQSSPQTDTEQTEREPENAYTPETVEETCYSNGNMLDEHEVADFAAEVTCDLNPKPPEEQIILNKQSKRRSRRNTKPKDYKSGEDNEDREPAKPIARRKKVSASEYSCKDCGKVFKYKHFLVMHRRIHTGECPFTCAECGKGFSQKHSLRVHERIHTGERPYSCTICSKSLSTKNSLMEHMRIHAEKKSFTCDKCGKIFSQKKQLKSHYRIHIGDGLRDCKICQRTFMDSAQLKKHLRSHTGEKPYTCEVCGKSFTARSSLLTHMRIHRGEKPYTCNICGKAFSDSSAKRRHMTLHTGEKPYACSDCNLQFSRQDNLKAHIKSHSRVRKPRAPLPITRLSLEAERIIQMQKEYQLAKRNGQELQYLVTEHVRNLNFMSGQGIVTAEAAPANVDQAANLTVITHQPPVLHGLQVAPNQQHVPPSHNISLVKSRIHTVLQEQMHVVTLPKEVFEQLHGRTHEIHLAQKHQPVTQVLSHPVPSVSNQGVRVPQHAPQTVAVAAVTQPVPSNPNPSQSFQVQSGAVTPIHKTTATPNSTSV